jgi:hypothetical protein
MRSVLLLAAVFPAVFFGQQPCASVTAFTPCDFTFELNDAEAAAHQNPYVSVEIQAEFRSPRHKTYLVPGFWAGGRKLVIRFAADEPGQWDYRVSGNIQRFEGNSGSFQATESEAPGFLRPTNLHHWATSNSESSESVNARARKPHLWMGDTCYQFAWIPRASFEQLISIRAQQKFNHLRGLVLGWESEQAKAFPAPDRPNLDYFRELDDRILFLNRKGIIADLVLAGGQDALTKAFPTWQDRERFVRFLIARYSSMNITWQGVHEWETYRNGRELMKEIGLLLKKLDFYNHPRTSDSAVTSSPLAGDGWMNYTVYESADNQLGSIEHQLYQGPFVNLRIGYEDSGAGKADPQHVDSDTFRRRLWNSTMDGQYPTYGNTGTYDGRKIPFNTKYAESAGAKAMSAWFTFFDDTRHWELEPYFDVDGGRALALEGVEYILYVEKPGPVEVAVEKHGYDVRWFNPANGEFVDAKKYKGERFAGEPPDASHDWVLYLSREGKKESMLKSYKFDSREYPLQLQEPEQMPQKIPFEIVNPPGNEIVIAKPAPYSVKLKKETRATREMMYLWTGDVVTDGQGARVLGTGSKGTLTVPAAIVKTMPNVISLRVAGMNANGKVYIYDKVYKLIR